MLTRLSSLNYCRIAFLVLAVLILAGNAFAVPTEKVVYSFPGPAHGVHPDGGLIADADGNLYGTTTVGGADKHGTVFELTPPATPGGAWTETVLYNFQGSPLDGANPYGTLIFDTQGNLYGTTYSGGNNNRGSIFELSPPIAPGGVWTETVLWLFGANGGQGALPTGKLAIDPSGNLYGTTYGPSSLAGCPCGRVFELVKPREAGSWAERILYRFGATAGDGAYPGPDLLLRGGILYGTTAEGGANGHGTVFQLVRKPGLWTETILYNFSGNAGSSPEGGLIADSAGNLFGTTYYGDGGVCCSAVYELSPPTVTGDTWQETTIHSFTGGADGTSPWTGVTRDSAGDLFGTTISGGKYGDGTVFKLKPPTTSGGAWTLLVLHSFAGSAGADGDRSYGTLTWLNGALYGTTFAGGSVGSGGTVFSVVP